MKAIKKMILSTNSRHDFWAFPRTSGVGLSLLAFCICRRAQTRAPSLTQLSSYYKKSIFFFLIIVTLISCQKERTDLSFDTSAPFIRFSLKVDGDGIVTSDPKDNNLNDETDSYTHTVTDVLKIPILLSGKPLEEDLIVDFSTEISGTFEGIILSETDQLILEAGTNVDTINIAFTDRWRVEDQAQIQLQINSINHPDIHIGYPRDFLTLDALQIRLGDISPNTIRFPEVNRVEVSGAPGETIDIAVEFSQGIIAAELEDQTLLSIVEGFNYTLSQHPFKDGDKRINYTFTIDEDLQIEDVSFQSTLVLNPDIENYPPLGNTTFQIVKPLLIPRDNAVFPAQHFYDLSDPFYRTYGEQWNDFDEDGLCTWRNFNAFTFPVIVAADDPNAILYDDMGTQDPADDIYHHAFRIGFNTVIEGNTTNAFNLKRWFNNESSDGAVSPGFNIQEAIAFFPENGDDPTKGSIQIIPQNITITASGDGGSSYLIAIEGEGSYEELPSGIFELIFELRATNMELFGGTQTGYYHLFNSNMYIDPDPIDAACITPVSL